MKSLLGDIEVAREYFEAFLEESLKKTIDLSRLKHSPTSFISEELKETHADIVFTCPLAESFGDQEVYLVLLVEHRSTPYKYVTIQLGGYIMDAYRKQISNKVEPLRVVLPFLYYHGSEDWEPPTMADIFKLIPPTLKDYLPLFQYIFRNIQDYSDEQIRKLGTGLLNAALLTQKYTGRPVQLKERLEQIFSIIDSWERRNLFDMLVVYIFEIIEIEREELISLIEKIPEEMKTEIVSLADHLRAEGREEERYRKNRIATENTACRGTRHGAKRL